MIDHQSPCSWKLKESRIEAHVSWLPDSHHIIRLMIIMIVMMIIMIIKLIMNGNMVLMINRKENICLSNCSYWQWPPWWPRPFHAKLSFCPAHWQSVTFRFRNFSIFLVVSDSVSKKLSIEKSIGFGIGKIWYRKKFRIRFRSDFGYRHTLVNTSQYLTSSHIVMNILYQY